MHEYTIGCVIGAAGSEEAIAAWQAPATGKRGGQPIYSAIAIETSLALRLVFHQPLRQTEGLLRSIADVHKIDIAIPDHTTLSRRGGGLTILPKRIDRTEPLHLLYGEDEWLDQKHGIRSRRRWRKLHLGVDADTHEIVAVELTPDDVGDISVMPDLLDQIDVVETLRQWMMADGLWVDRRHKLPSPHQPRRRREYLGELVQIDGSEHRWFEGRSEMCTLLAFVDDATSRLMQLRFVASESAFDYFRAAKDYLETHGKPVAFYSDKHGIFRVNAKDAIGGDRVTQFGRVLSELNIDIICANSPQAKGRVERAFGTLQDRLVKELRLAGISTIEAANAWVPAFMVDYNTRFGRAPENAKDLHRKLTEADDLREVLAWREVAGGNMLMRAGSGTEEVAQFVEAATEPVSRSWALEPTRRLTATFDAKMTLPQSIVEIAGCDGASCGTIGLRFHVSFFVSTFPLDKPLFSPCITCCPGLTGSVVTVTCKCLVHFADDFRGQN